MKTISKPICISFFRFIREIFNDAMLAAMTILPLMLGLLFKFGIPALELFIESKTGYAAVIAPYYILFDLTIIFSTPVMFGYAGLMVILEERDNGIMKYLCVTPLRFKGYIFSRLIFLSAISSLYGFFVEIFFHLSGIGFVHILLGCVFSFLTGIWIVCLIILLASNKVEGLAFSKFSGLLILGPFASFFLNDWVKYLTGFLPTFWFTEFCLNPNSYGIIALVISFAITGLYLALTITKSSKFTY